MPELNVAELTAQIAQQERAMKNAQQAMGRLAKRQAAINLKLKEFQNKGRASEYERGRLSELLTITTLVIPSAVLERREVLLAKHERVQRDDITVAEKRSLERDIEELGVALRLGCVHPLVLHYSGWEGFPPEYEDSYYGYRVCAVCGYKERSGSTRRDEYTALVPVESRLIKSDDHYRKAYTSLNGGPRLVWVPFEEIRAAFIAAAGKSRVEWTPWK